MQITVTMQDILDGQMQACYACPIALAVARQTGTQWRILNYSATHPDKPVRVTLPEEAATFIAAFDSVLPVDPFTFEFPIETATKI